MDFGRNDTSKYFEAKNCHSGAGTIKLMSLWEKFETPWMFIHRGILPPKTGIGHHFHDRCEEMYVIFNGSSYFTHNGNNVGNIERLGNEVSSPVADGFLSIAKGSVPGDDHNLYIRL